MALTNENFRDPRRLFKLRVKSPFFITGQKDPTKVGDIVSLPRSQAAEVVHSNKAIWHDEDPAVASTNPIRRADPPQMPAPEVKTPATTDAKASAKKE